MKNILTLSNENLVSRIENLAREKKKLTIEVIHCLYEIQRRRLFAEFAYCSLYQFCVERLRYSEGAAHRRISAMKMIYSLPFIERQDTERKIEEGIINLTNLSLLYRFIKIEKKVNGKNYEEIDRARLVTSIENKSKKEVERLLLSMQPSFVVQESERALSNNCTQITFIANEELMGKIRRTKEITAHRDPNPTYSELFDFIIEEYLKRKDPDRVIVKNKAVKTSAVVSAA